VRLRTLVNGMRRAAAASAATVFLVALPAGAQILRIDGPREPAFWVSGGIGYAQFNRGVYDGATQSLWNFGSGLVYRASVEKTISNQSSLGLMASYGRLPLRYYDLRTDATGDCALNDRGCTAHAQVTSFGALFHAGGGPGVHQVIEASAGVTRYANFERDGDGATLSSGTNTDGSITVGYGIGYTLSRVAQVALVQDYSAILHERKGLPSGQSALTQAYTTRLTVRLGAGSRRPGV